ncbi:hypothetical protein ACFFJX_25275 [Pseudarcicella hirudinis]|uniref:hypothetical protein n=1 Tax=Pseudarcicella hirudinis TaxID=1079859 RepID=UPI0035E7961A
MLNALNEDGEISRSHGLHHTILKAQAQAMDVPIDFYCGNLGRIYRKKIYQKASVANPAV